MRDFRFKFGAATLLAFDLILFAPLAVTGGVFSSHDYVRAQHPWRMSPGGVVEAENRLFSDQAASGQTTLVRMRRFPSGFFWNPWVSSGSVGPVLLAQGFLSPFTALPALLLPEAGIETGILFLKFHAAFILMYAFLRSRRFSDVAAAAGAATWAFSTAQTLWALWMHTSVSITFPLLLMAVDRAFEEGSRARAVRFGALAFLLCLSGGFPHWILYGAFAAGVDLLLRAAAERRRQALVAAARLTGSLAIAVAIFLPGILVTARFLDASGYRELRRGIGSSFALPLRHARLYFVPEYYGTPRRDDYRGIGWIPGDNYMETAVGVGIAAAGLAFVGLPAFRRRREAVFAAVLGAAVAIPLYAGGAILAALGRLPLLDISLFARAKILIILAVAVLVACGVEALERLASSEMSRLCVRVAPFLIAVPLAFRALDFYPECSPRDAIFRDTPGIARLRDLTSGGWRFAAAGWTLIPNVSEPLGLEDARGHFLLEEGYRRLVTAADPNAFGGYGTYLAFDPLSLDPSSPVLDLLGVRFLAAPPGVASPVGPEVEARDSATFHLPGAPVRPATTIPPRVYAGADMTIFERGSALFPFRLVGRALSGGLEETRAADRATLADAVFIAPSVQARLAGNEGKRRGDGRVRVLEALPERFTVQVETEAPAILASSRKAFRPYWRLTLDGREAEGFEVNGLFLGLEVPKGTHRIEGRFVIPRWELAVSALGLLALAATMMWATRSPARA